MSPYLRQVKTASGATAVQVVAKDHGVRRIVEHLGSAHDEADEVGGQAPGDGGAVRRPQIISRRSGWLIEALRSAYRRLGLGEAVGGDRAFEQMVAARLIEPTSKADTPRVLSRSAGRPRLTATPCTRPWAAVSSGATARRSLGPCSSTSPPVGGWPCACRRDHALLRGRA